MTLKKKNGCSSQDSSSPDQNHEMNNPTSGTHWSVFQIVFKSSNQFHETHEIIPFLGQHGTHAVNHIKSQPPSPIRQPSSGLWQMFLFSYLTHRDVAVKYALSWFSFVVAFRAMHTVWLQDGSPRSGSLSILWLLCCTLKVLLQGILWAFPT